MDEPPFDLVVMVASAGGLSAISTTLADLPADLPTAVVVAQHLGGQGSLLVEILRRRLDVPVSWAEDGMPLKAGEVLLCPPRQGIEVLPDGTISLTPLLLEQRGRVLDQLFASVAASYGARALGVVLTGMGQDGAQGARSLRTAGGTVIAQSVATAEHPSMPAAAVAAGAVDLVLPLAEIGAVVSDLLHGSTLPRSAEERTAAATAFVGTDEVSALYRSVDWRDTRLGPVAGWPPELRALVSTALECPTPTCLLWGPDLLQLYNDAYRSIMGAKHPAGLAQPARECWPEVWHLNEPVYAEVLAGGSRRLEGARYPITRHGPLEDAWFDLTHSPVRDAAGVVVGITVSVVEATARILAARRLATLQRLTADSAGLATRRETFAAALEAVCGDGQDVLYAMGWFVDAASRAQLTAAVGVEAGGPMARHTVPLGAATTVWPLREALEQGRPLLVDRLGLRFRGELVGAEQMEPDRAVVVPLPDAGAGRPAVLVLGLPDRLPFDAAYREFVGLVGREVEAALVRAGVKEREHERLERLAQLDRAKVEFFSNVSHEFRTPLALMLGPLDALAERSGLSDEMSSELHVARRNARRLLGLVDGLLDFSQLEAGRLRAQPVLVDLAALTSDVSELFRQAAEGAGLRLVVSCPPLPTPVWVDAGMWEKVVSNLLSNAIKFTFEGEVRVELRQLPQHVELVVSDTGVGIPTEELPHVFQRFHRVRGTRARTHEGAGIGLALVDQLVRLHHGRVRATSTAGLGTSMTVWVRAGKPVGLGEPVEPDGTDAAGASGPADPVLQASSAFAAAQAGMAEAWARPVQPVPTDVAPELVPGAAHVRVPEARLLVVDDNADLRDYLGRLLGAHWTLVLAADGEQALAAMEREAPDLVLTDVLMPGLDGFELLARIRAHPTLHNVPVVLLTAHAGEESAVRGLLAGADDYLVKPFSARELVARVGAQLQLSRLRREGERRFDALRQASWDAVYVMNPDWSEMRTLDGRGFIADTEEPTGTWLEKYIDPADQPRVLAAIDQAVATRGVFELEHRVRQADGSLGWTLSRAIPLVDHSDRVVEWVGTATALPGHPDPEAPTG